MDVSRIRALRGPNLWTRHTAIEALVRCQPEDQLSAHPGFESRLRHLFPGIAVAEDCNNFTPASDVIIGAKQLPKLRQFIRLCKINKQIAKGKRVPSFAPHHRQTRDAAAEGYAWVGKAIMSGILTESGSYGAEMALGNIFGFADPDATALSAINQDLQQQVEYVHVRLLHLIK